MDLRLPLGLFFLLVGILLAGYGLVSDRAIYAASLGHNVNLWWGIVMMVFGAAMYLGSRRYSRRRASAGQRRRALRAGVRVAATITSASTKSADANAIASPACTPYRTPW